MFFIYKTYPLPRMCDQTEKAENYTMKSDIRDFIVSRPPYKVWQRFKVI